MEPSFQNKGLLYFFAAVITLILLIYASLLSEVGSVNTPNLILIFYLFVIPYLGMVWSVQKKPINPGWIFLGAVIFRVVFLFSDFLLSDDVYRYIWDGHLINFGVSPYLFAVNNPLLDGYEIKERLLVNHNWMASPYLLTAQAYFGFITKIFPQSVMAFRLSTVLLDLFTAVVIYKILQLMKRNPSLVLIYAWHPLIIFESTLGAHIDFLMMFFVITSLYFLLKSFLENHSKQLFLNLSSILFAASVLTKGWPLLFVPILFWFWGWRRTIIVMLVTIAGIFVFVPSAGLGLFGVMDGTGVLGAVRIYLQYWQFNGSTFSLLSGLMNYLPIKWLSNEKLVQITRLVSMIIFVGLLSWVSVSFKQKFRKITDPYKLFYTTLQAMLIGYGLFLLFSATVHPWYLVLLIPFITILAEKPLRSPWLWFSITVSLSYLLYINQNWKWVLWAEYLPVYGLLIWALIRRRLFFEFPD
ncbi:MAG: hypothetical protein CL609_10005 [Anaerolineaceae bacterium]|nr:hypothetical protein [Anaerolineaceae bacterium]